MQQILTGEHALAEHLPLARLCRMLQVPRASYYRRAFASADPLSGAAREAARLVAGRLEALCLEMPAYGYRMVTKQLQREGFSVNHKRVLRLMRERDLLCPRTRKKAFLPQMTEARPGQPFYPNLARGMVLVRPNQLWVADITYIHLPREFAYLAVLLDAYSRLCLGWALEVTYSSLLSLEALKMALAARRITAEAALVHHSDRGWQYACDEYTRLLQDHGISISMSRKGNPYDNATCESFIKTIKYNEVYLADYQTVSEARMNIDQFLKSIYNERRLHSSLGYVTPKEYEDRYYQNQQQEALSP